MHLPGVPVSLGGTALFIGMAKVMRVALWTRAALHPMVLLRNLFEIIGAVGMVVGLKHVSLPVFAAIIQTGPLVVTLGAAIFLKEEVGWRRWTAVAVGILGMLMVIRPFSAVFTGWELFAVLGITALSARDLVGSSVKIREWFIYICTWAIPVGIPALIHEESLHGVMARDATCFPQSIGQAATWDPDIVEEVARLIGRHLRSSGASQALAPVLDISRDLGGLGADWFIFPAMPPRAPC